MRTRPWQSNGQDQIIKSYTDPCRNAGPHVSHTQTRPTAVCTTHALSHCNFVRTHAHACMYVCASSFRTPHMIAGPFVVHHCQQASMDHSPSTQTMTTTLHNHVHILHASCVSIHCLQVSVYEEDEEALSIWRDVVGVDPGHIKKMGAEDNFWASGPTGMGGRRGGVAWVGGGGGEGVGSALLWGATRSVMRAEHDWHSATTVDVPPRGEVPQTACRQHPAFAWHIVSSTSWSVGLAPLCCCRSLSVLCSELCSNLHPDHMPFWLTTNPNSAMHVPPPCMCRSLWTLQ
jgi:hypothetical protein